MVMVLSVFIFSLVFSQRVNAQDLSRYAELNDAISRLNKAIVVIPSAGNLGKSHAGGIVFDGIQTDSSSAQTCNSEGDTVCELTFIAKVVGGANALSALRLSDEVSVLAKEVGGVANIIKEGVLLQLRNKNCVDTDCL